jgi:hypothetical protein
MVSKELLMTRTNFMRMLIGCGGMVTGASFVLVLRGAALAGTQRLEVAHAHSKVIVTASVPKAPTLDSGASAREVTASYPSM